MRTRICVIGGGLAGSLLAWRLAAPDGEPGVDVDLVTGPPDAPDATGVSGGYVRAYETDDAQRRLASESLAELLGSSVLRSWSGFERAGSTYVRDGPPDEAALAEIERLVPGSARTASPAELARGGWAGLPDSAVAVLEDEAGYLSPDQLRRSVVADFAARRNSSVVSRPVHKVSIEGDVQVRHGADHGFHRYDLVVVAAGPWTPAWLRAQGWPSPDLRTKAIQFTLHRTRGPRPTPFVDDTSGLYGRPTTDGGMLLGIPSTEWNVDPDRMSAVPALSVEALRLARQRFPSLRIDAARQTAVAADCYGEPAGLALRSVPGTGGRLFAFTGGSGGSAKTALAASTRAADTLVGRGAGRLT
jgi:glycine/D-amino acid oxidase-like deaminating enzyme